MDTAFFVKGLVIGIAVAAPVGPIGVLCIQRTLAGGKVHGFISGLGAATADAIYGSIAAFGLTFIATFLIEQQDWVRLIGGAFLCYLGARAFVAQPVEHTDLKQRSHHVGAYASTFVLTLTNPATILSFVAIFAGLGVVRPNPSYVSASLLVTGVFLGSGVWWLMLAIVTGTIHSRLSREHLVWINRTSGMIMATFGVLAIATLVR
jgi:threonine/homoserine/homoserine lactone efflux protein